MKVKLKGGPKDGEVIKVEIKEKNCSFCGNNSKDFSLIESPSGKSWICHDCVYICLEIIAVDKHKKVCPSCGMKPEEFFAR